MGNKLYVGNLSYGVSNADLEQAFSAHGAVRSAMVVMDRETGRSKGFGFVEMQNDDEARNAISNLHESEVMGRKLIVNEARPQEKRPSGYGGGGARASRGAKASCEGGTLRHWVDQLADAVHDERGVCAVSAAAPRPQDRQGQLCLFLLQPGPAARSGRFCGAESTPYPEFPAGKAERCLARAKPATHRRCQCGMPRLTRTSNSGRIAQS